MTPAEREVKAKRLIDLFGVIAVLTQWLMKFLKSTAGAKDLAGFIPAPV